MLSDGAPTVDRGQLRWRAGRHALLELDIVFQRFLERHFDDLSEAECVSLKEFLLQEDHDIWEMVSGRRACEEARWQGLVAVLQQCGEALVNQAETGGMEGKE